MRLIRSKSRRFALRTVDYSYPELRVPRATVTKGIALVRREVRMPVGGLTQEIRRAVV